MKLSYSAFFLFTILLVTLSTVVAAPLPASQHSPAKPQPVSSVNKSTSPNPPPDKPPAPDDDSEADDNSQSNEKDSDSKSDKPSHGGPKENDAFCFGCLGGSPGMGAPRFDGHLFGGFGFGGFRGGR